ncbi:ParB/RepB/Spo0J family partition protein [Phenylobacterium montanum]|uniref:ParB/RepB/Spo0J family partition protein n=1 Tax=Phenylobacterium montanum TaxID=2823693 RepID=A0A975G4I2_9CAUL|nr:ParB/RepB/Spo0J family partition protein [Caulobacter sp. S6]QUD90428.1 ParB/RepB/Spo0J family partition protein [Caulobacter sp. S6]
MTQSSKIVLSASRDIPFNKLVLSQSNVRRIKAGVSIEELAEDIARRTLLQSLTVRAVVGADGQETGKFEVPAGGRRYRALELLVKQKRLAKTAPVPCVVREGGVAEEDSLAENVQRAPLHPLDQFRAFLALREKGQSEEDIAAAFFTTAAVVKQRLRLASVSPKLLEVYAEDGMTLEQLMAFTVSADHQRQEEVFDRLRQSHGMPGYMIRRILTEGAVRFGDKRVLFIGPEAYLEAGGDILRDLFERDDGGWLQDAALLDRLVAEKLDREANAVRAEGWRWIEVASDLPYDRTFGLRSLRGEVPPLTEEEEAARTALQTELDELEAKWADTEDLPPEVDERLGELEAALAAFDERPATFDPADIAIAGAFVSIDGSGALRVERGYVRPEDEPPVAAVGGAAEDEDGQGDQQGVAPPASAVDAEEDEGVRPIPDRLLTELTAHRTVALREALGANPDVAFLAALHALCLKLFYRYGQDSCLELDVKHTTFSAQAPDLADCSAAVAIETRRKAWVQALPTEAEHLWGALQAFDSDSRQALFAHCVAQSVNAVYEVYNRKPRALAHADRLAEALDLDMVAAGWAPTVSSFLGRVSKARILGAVAEACGAAAASRIEPLKKTDMAEAAEGLLAGLGWLPEPLRTPGRAPAWVRVALAVPVEEMAADGRETAMVEAVAAGDDAEVPIEAPPIAAE